ncbi:ATP-binding protein [Brotaphodocola sp.]|uniref:hybrid sensor histidine kinase/response regulator n=1 Tax=Brotaphodocola sp. TaxID=3073577 RepID=UPI003D7CAEB3
MNEKRKRTNKKWKYKTNQSDWHTLFLVIVAFVMLVSIGVVSFLRFYDSYIDGLLYRERLTQMKEVTTQLFTGLEDVVQNQWDNTDVLCSYVEKEEPKTAQKLQAFMADQAQLNKAEQKGAHLVAVDNLGRYLTEEGWQGTLVEMNLLLSESERISFVSKSMTTSQTFMYFLQRLDEPIVMQDGDRTVSLIYYGVAREMEQLNPYFTCEAYDNSNSVYVLDKQGMRLFRSQNSSSLLQGYNAYSTLEQMEYLHENSFSEAKHELDRVGRGYANAVLEGEEYYYALYQMDHADWILLFLVPSSHVATDVVVMVDTTVRLILIFAVILVAISALVIILLMGFQQKKAVEAERQNSEKLEKVNEKLAEAVTVAEKATKAKSDFLANMSHDIRTPMNAIVGITSLMAREPGLSDHLHGYISKVQMSSQHLLSLINDVLDMSKIESSGVTLNDEPVNFAELIGQVDNIIRSQTNERGQSFQVRVHALAHEYVISDNVRLRQLLLNLLSNATKYTPAGGKVMLDLTEEACEKTGYATYQIAVTDNGYGMTPEFVEHIFEPFTRSENSVTNKIQGTGLGMAIAKSIVDLMGGTISVESALNQGSRFEVTLPLKIDYNVDMTTEIGTVLLISEDEVLRHNLLTVMQAVRVGFYMVSTRAEAMELMKKQNMDVVLLNGHLLDPDLSETVADLRRMTGDTSLIFFVDYVQSDQMEDRVKASGMDGLIPRPFFLSNLLRAMEQIRNVSLCVEDTASTLKGLHFLCAEDNELNAEILETMLKMEGASCTIFHNGREIVEAFKTVKPGEYDAILMDVQMPLMNGLDATRAIRSGENPLGKTIPILAMTANAFSEDIQNSMSAGMNAHISKPIDIRILEREMSRFVIRGGGREENEDFSAIDQICK